MYASELKDASRERLTHDLRNVMSDIELFLSASAGEAGESYDAALAKLTRALDSTKARVEEVQRHVAGTTRAAAQATDTYVHENAWSMIALAAVAGVVAGVIVARR